MSKVITAKQSAKYSLAELMQAYRLMQNILVKALETELLHKKSTVNDKSELLLPEHATVYSSILLLVALKYLQHNSPESALVREILPSSQDALELDPEHVHLVITKLFEYTQYFWANETSQLIPSPALLARETMQTLQKLNQADLSLLWEKPTTIGYSYQFLAAAARKQSQLEIQSSDKQFNLRKIIAFTQIYTPDWVVDYLLTNSIIPQWKYAKEKSFPYLWEQKNGNVPHNLTAGEITVLDPACGSGHFLLLAFDHLFELHKFEKTNPKDAIKEIITKSLFGVDIDLFGLWTTALSLLVRCLSLNIKIDFKTNNLCHTPQNSENALLLGSLFRDCPNYHPLAKKYNAVITNPPYIGRKLLNRQLKALLKKEYSDCHHDLCAPFIVRGLELLKPNGRLGMITQVSLLHLPSYAKLRRQLVQNNFVVSAVEVGPGVFPLQGGEKVNSVLLVIENDRERERHTLFTNIDDTDKPLTLQSRISAANNHKEADYYLHKQKTFLADNRCAFTYSCPEELSPLFSQSPKLEDLADVRQGLATTDNERFVRYWWEIAPEEIHRNWFPYIKGAGSERWSSPIKYVINWQNNGAEIKQAVSKAYPYLKGNISWVVKNEQHYFRPGLCFSFVSSRNLAVRNLPAGCIFDVGASAVFANNNENFLLAYLNSSFVNAAAKHLNPTINFQVGDIKKLPILKFQPIEIERLAELAKKGIAIKQELDSYCDCGLDTVLPSEIKSIWKGAEPIQQFAHFEQNVRDNIRQLDDLDQSINALTFDKMIHSLGTKDTTTIKKLEKWLDDTKVSAKTVINSANLGFFAHSLMRAAIEQSLSLIEKSSLLLVPNNAKEIMQTILPQSSTDWWQQLFGVTIDKFLTEIGMPKRFFSIAPYCCLRLPSSNWFLLGNLRQFTRPGVSISDLRLNILQKTKTGEEINNAEGNGKDLAAAQNEAISVIQSIRLATQHGKTLNKAFSDLLGRARNHP